MQQNRYCKQPTIKEIQTYKRLHTSLALSQHLQKQSISDLKRKKQNIPKIKTIARCGENGKLGNYKSKILVQNYFPMMDDNIYRYTWTL